jgi:ABC-type multidrug transport system permease subunit
MNRTWRIARKELLQTGRDRLAFLFTLVLPVVFTVVLGILIGGAQEAADRLPVAVVSLDDSPAATQLLDKLKNSLLLELQTLPEDEIDKAVLDQDVAAGIVIPAGFGAAIEQGRTAPVSLIRVETSTGGQSVRTAVDQAISELNVSMLAAAAAAEQISIKTGRALDEDLLESARSAVDSYLANPAVTVESTEAGGSSLENASGFDLSSSGALVNWVLFSLLTVATGIAWERRRGLLRRLSTVGVPGAEIISGKMVAMVIITFTQQALLILLGQLAFGVDYFNSPLALLMTMISLSVLAASVGLLISSVFRSEQAVIATTVISAQLLAALGGAWFPLEITSASFSRVAHFLPTAWIMDSLHGIILKDWGVADVVFPLAIVWIWVVVLFGSAVWRFRPE